MIEISQIEVDFEASDLEKLKRKIRKRDGDKREELDRSDSERFVYANPKI